MSRRKPLESSIQRSIKAYGEKLGWRVRKRSTVGVFGSNGEPDLEFLKGAPSFMWLMEVKSPGKKSTPLQIEVQNELRALGFTVYADIDTVAEGKRLIDEMTAAHFHLGWKLKHSKRGK